MHEAVHRTLHRLNEMLNMLSELKIDWTAHEESMAELRNLLKVVDDVADRWGDESPYTEAFGDILHVNSAIHTRMECALRERTCGK